MAKNSIIETMNNHRQEVYGVVCNATLTREILQVEGIPQQCYVLEWGYEIPDSRLVLDHNDTYANNRNEMCFSQIQYITCNIWTREQAQWAIFGKFMSLVNSIKRGGNGGDGGVKVVVRP
jgi:hypothetical protein